MKFSMEVHACVNYVYSAYYDRGIIDSHRLFIGRNMPVVLDLSNKDTIRILMRRSGVMDQEFGLFNGGQPLAGYGRTSNVKAPTGEIIDTAKSGTGYWVQIPPNTNITSITNSSWDYLEIPLTSFTSQTGFNAKAVTGWGIRHVGATPAGNLHARPRFYVDNIAAYNKADEANKRVINLTQPATGGTIAVNTPTSALDNEMIRIDATPASGWTLETVTVTPYAEVLQAFGYPQSRIFLMPPGTGPVSVTATLLPPRTFPPENFETGVFIDDNGNGVHNTNIGFLLAKSEFTDTISGTFDTTEKRPGTTGLRSVKLKFRFSDSTNTGRSGRFAYRGYVNFDATDASGNTSLKFWVRATLPGTYQVITRQAANNTDRTGSFTISAANTWQEITVAVPGTDAQRSALNYLGFGFVRNTLIGTSANTDYFLWIDDVSLVSP